MAEYSLYGKKKLCYTDIVDYTDYQGIGKDPLYKRYDSVKSVVKRHIPKDLQHFLSQPIYESDEDVISWYIEEWNQEPKRLVELDGEEFNRYNQIKETTISIYKECLFNLNGEDRVLLGGALKYIHDDAIYCYDNKVVLVAWGMKPDTKRHIITGSIIHDFVVKKKFVVHFDAGEHGHFKHKFDDTLQREEGYELSKDDLPVVIPEEGYKFKDWSPSPYGIKVTEEMSFKAIYEPVPCEVATEPLPEKSSVTEPKEEPVELVTIEFKSDGGGNIVGNSVFEVEKGTSVDEIDIPEVVPSMERIFTGWYPIIPNRFTRDCVFTAHYEDPTYECRFQAGKLGDLQGTTVLKKRKGEGILDYELPTIEAHKGYKFTGWDIDPLTFMVDRNCVFTAQYEKLDPWYKRCWAWLTSENVKKWIKRILLLLLIILLVILLSRSCSSCHREYDTGYKRGAEPIEQITTPDGTVIDDNNGRGANESIIGDDGTLPDNQSFVVAPIVGDEGVIPPIHSEPGRPDIIANRLNIYFEDDNVNLQSFADAFKRLYTTDQYQIIGCDNHVKMIQIQIPEEERNTIREKLPSQFTDFKFFIVDESLFRGYAGKKGNRKLNGWHLRAIHAQEAWKVTQGHKDVVVAVVDDGLDYTHPMFKDRIVNAYNVFTQDNRLSMGEGHGTHVAGLAVGSTEFIERGAAGIAPHCLLMPVQIFDNEYCTFSSVTSGIMYAIHKGADVINLSVGMSFQGLSQLPISQQEALSDMICTNEEMVWKKIIDIANKKNCILVFAVGNDKVLATIPPENRIGSSINVAAVAPDLSAAHFSNFGEGSNVSAPGVEIVSAFPTQTFQSCDGTSMAAPIVSGAVALMRSVDEDINVQDVLNVLNATGVKTDKRIPPMIQLDKALMKVKSGDYTNVPSDSETDNGMTNPSLPVPDESENPTNNDDKKNGISEPTGNEGNVEENKQPTPDYASIRALIEEYKRKINELEKQLPENKLNNHE